MSIFNKAGDEFTHIVTLPRDPNVEPIYRHTFPAQVGNKVVERWSTKVRPIKDMTYMLRACRLLRNKDYMVDYNGVNKVYEYWFKQKSHAVQFKLMVGNSPQQISTGGTKFKIKCPCCSNTFNTDEIEWV